MALRITSPKNRAKKKKNRSRTGSVLPAIPRASTQPSMRTGTAMSNRMASTHTRRRAPSCPLQGAK